jgi:hypothetical protein
VSPTTQPRRRAPLLPALVLAVLVTALAALLAGCGDTLQVRPIPHNELEALIVAPFRVYWLGDSFKGLAVSSVSHDPGEAYTVRYGNCLTGGQGNCVPPLIVVSSPDNGFLPGGAAPRRTTQIRGVSALEADGGRVFVLPAGNVVIDVYASNAKLARAAARSVAAINAPGSPLDPLPAPAPPSTFAATPLRSQVPSPLRPLSR